VNKQNKSKSSQGAPTDDQSLVITEYREKSLNLEQYLSFKEKKSKLIK